MCCHKRTLGRGGSNPPFDQKVTVLGDLNPLSTCSWSWRPHFSGLDHHYWWSLPRNLQILLVLALIMFKIPGLSTGTYCPTLRPHQTRVQFIYTTFVPLLLTYSRPVLGGSCILNCRLQTTGIFFYTARGMCWSTSLPNLRQALWPN